MKKFIKNILAFASIIFLFNFCIFIFARKNYYAEYERIPDPKIRKVLFADSHGLHLESLPESYGVYNFSSGSDSYTDIKRKLLFLLKSGYKLDTVFLFADNHTLSPYRDSRNNNDRSEFYLSSNDFNNYYEFLKERYFIYYIPLFQPKVTTLFSEFITTKTKSILKKKKKFTESNWATKTQPEKIKNSLNRKKTQFDFESASTLQKQTLNDIIQVCKKKHIAIIGIKFPLTKEYLEVLQEKSFGADSLMLNNNINVIGNSALFINNPDYFSDQDHLNYKGAVLFCEMIFGGSQKR